MTAVSLALWCCLGVLLGAALLVIPLAVANVKGWPTEPGWLCSLGVATCIAGSAILSVSCVAAVVASMFAI